MTRFMQLNPARGRKLKEIYGEPDNAHGRRFMQLNLARGRKLEEVDRKLDHRHRSKIYAS